ncbi:MAG: cupin domain-containing protein [Paracoccaceae bacterium]
MGLLDLDKVPVDSGSSYPEPYATEMGNRAWQSLGDAGGLTQFGVRLMIMQPGSKSSLRHWRETEDEFVMVTEGETAVRPGDCAAFPAGDTNGHHFINRSDREARFLVVGTRVARDVCTYSDVDLRVEIHGDLGRFTRKDGTPLPTGMAETRS